MALTGQFGTVNSRLGSIVFGFAVVATPVTPALPTTSLPYIAHVYGTNYAFKGTLGPLLNRPTLKSSLNGGYGAILIEVPNQSTNASPTYGQVIYGTPLYGGGIGQGDIIQLTEQGGDGSVVYTGIVEDVPDDYGAATRHAYDLSPMVVELGDTPFSAIYGGADPAQMVRDAVASTPHLYYTDQTIPLTGLVSSYTFSHVTCLDVLGMAKHMSGTAYWWHVDAGGRVWFQSTYPATAATYTLGQGVNFSDRKFKAPIGLQRNQVFAVGGVPSGGSAPITSTYNDTASQSRIGIRAYNPPLLLPTVADQVTLDAITNSIGGMLNRRATTIDLEVENYPTRIVVGQAGGGLLRYYEPAIQPLQESGTGSGLYSGPYVVQAVEVDGAKQFVRLTTTPTSIMDAQDLDFEIGRLLARMSVQPLVSPALPLNQATTMASNGYSAITDADGNIRHEFGNLNAYTDPSGIVSPAHYGDRTRDATGNLLSDSIGLTGVMKSLGNAGQSGTLNFASSTYADVTGTTVGVTTSRQVNLLVLWIVTGKVTSGTGNGLIRCNPGVAGSPTGGGYLSVANYITISGYQFLPGVAAGTYTIKLQAADDDNVTNLQLLGSNIQVFQLGA